MPAGTVLQILFLSSLCQSKPYVTSRYFQEYSFNQNLIFISGLIKQGGWPNMGYAVERTSSEILEYMLFIPWIVCPTYINHVEKITGREARNLSLSFWYQLPVIKLHCWGLIRYWELHDHMSLKMQDNLLPKVPISIVECQVATHPAEKSWILFQKEKLHWSQRRKGSWRWCPASLLQSGTVTILLRLLVCGAGRWGCTWTDRNQAGIN